MNTVVADLQATLSQMDPQSASKLERLVRTAMELAGTPKRPAPEVDANGWPIGYWEKTAGSMAGERWEVADDPPPEPLPAW